MMNDNDNSKSDVVDREFVRYPILRKGIRKYYFSAFPKTKISHIKKEFRSEWFSEIVSLDLPYPITIALFPGWENFYNFEDLEEDHGKTSSWRFVSSIFIPAIGGKQIKLENLKKVKNLYSPSPQNSFNIWTISMGLKSYIELSKNKYFSKKSMSQMMYLIGREMIEKHKFDFWDEKQLYRFYTMNAFLGNKHDDKTYGEFISNHEEELWNNYRSLSNFYNHKYTVDFYLHFLELNSILNYFHLHSEKSEILINSLTKDQIRYIVDNEKNFPKIGNSGSGHFEKLKKSIESLRNINNSDSDSQIKEYDRVKMSKSIQSLIAKMLKKYDFDANFEDIKVIGGYGIAEFVRNVPKSHKDRKMLMSLFYSSFSFANTKTIYQQDTRRKITELMDENWDKVETWEFIAFLYILATPKHLFNRAGERGYTVILESIEKFGFAKFVSFAADVMMDYDGELPTYSDWRKFLDNDEEIPDDMAPSLFFALMLDVDRNQKRTLNEILEHRKNVKRIQEICQ